MAEVVKNNPEFSVDLLAVLGPAVCSLDVEGLKALSVVGLDLGSSCPSCLTYLATRATEELGTVHSWTQHFVYSLQAIVAGLSYLTRLIRGQRGCVYQDEDELRMSKE